MNNKISLTVRQVKELAELVGFTVTDDSVDDWIPDDSKVTIHQFDEPRPVSDEDGILADYWDTVATFNEVPENGSNPLGPSSTDEELPIKIGGSGIDPYG